MTRTVWICEDCGEDNAVHVSPGKTLFRCVTCGCKFRDDICPQCKEPLEENQAFHTECCVKVALAPYGEIMNPGPGGSNTGLIMSITKHELEQWKRELEEITPGEWHREQSTDGDFGVFNANDTCIAEFIASEDAKFIASAPERVRRLIEEIERLNVIKCYYCSELLDEFRNRRECYNCSNEYPLCDSCEDEYDE